MPRLKLLLLDAGIVIGLHELGLWERMLDLCEITLTRTVAIDEAVFWEDASGQRHYIDQAKLEADIAAGRLHRVDVSLGEVKAFCAKFDRSYLDRLDAGEVECLTFLLSAKEEWLLSSSDAIVFKVLGRLHLAERGISLEEILTRTGLSRTLHWKYTKAFRLRYTGEGQRDSITDVGLR